MMQASGDVSDDSDNDVTSPLLHSRVRRRTDDNLNIQRSNDGRTPSLASSTEYKSRWRSIRVVYLVMFLGSVTFTITMSSLWPFLQVLNPNTDTSFLGWVVAAYSLGQLVASPLFGGWANVRNSSREPLAVSLIMTVLSSIFYMYLESMPSHGDYFMILARGLIGFSAGNVAVVRSYVSGATTVEERTASMANLSIFQAMGFILGPVIQAALVPISYPGPVHSAYFYFNMYTAPAFFAACVATISIFLLIFVFKEHRVFDDNIKAILQSRSSDVEDQSSVNNDSLSESLRQFEYKMDYVAVFSSIFLFFVVLFMFTVFETIGTPLTMDMYAWTKDKATLYQGIILGVAGLLSIVVFMLVKILTKKYSERYLLLGGFVFCLCGYITFIPWGSKLPPIGFAPINGTVSSSNAIFTLSNYLLNGENPNNLPWSISKRDASFGIHKRNLVHKFEIPGLGFYTDVLHNDSSKIDHRFINGDKPFVYNDGQNSRNKDSKNFSSSFRDSRAHVPNSKKALSTFDDKDANSRRITQPFLLVATTTTDLASDLIGNSSIVTTTASSHNTNSTSASNGCPWQFEWCKHVPLIYFGQFLGGTALISIGYPVCNMLSYALYSKVLGPKPQGLWMGWLTASGSLARTVGPIYVSQVYDSFGPQITFGSCCGIIVITIVFYLAVYRQMVPFTFKGESLSQFGASTSERSVN